MAITQARGWRAVLMGAAIALLLASCESGGGTSRHVVPGQVRAGKLVLNSEMEWTRGATSRSQLWTMDGELLNLTYKEFELLNYLVENGQRTVAREELLTRLWRDAEEIPNERTIDVHIRRERSKLVKVV